MTEREESWLINGCLIIGIILGIIIGHGIWGL